MTHTNQHVSIAEFYPEGTFVTTGLSKWCGAGGWRLGIAFVPDLLGPTFKRALLGIGSETYSSAASPVQKAAVIAFTDDSTPNYIGYQRDILSALGQWCAKTLQKSGVNVHIPEGGFYLYPDFSDLDLCLATRSITDSNSLCGLSLGALIFQSLSGALMATSWGAYC